MAASGAFKVLVVEDEDELRDLYGRSLHALGYEVHTAADKPAAIKKLLDHAFHLVWVDLALDGDRKEHEGQAIIRIVKAMSPGTRVIVVSGYDEADNVLAAVRNRGADDFISKQKINPYSKLAPHADRISGWFKSSSIDDPVEFEHASRALFPEDRPGILASKIASQLRINAKVLNRLLLTIYNNLKPINVPVDPDQILTVDEQGASLRFWSKRYGSAVIVRFDKEVKGADENLIISRDKPISFQAYSNADPRDRYQYDDVSD